MASLVVLAAAVVQTATSAVTGVVSPAADTVVEQGAQAAGAAQVVETLTGGAGVRGAVEGLVTMPATDMAAQGVGALANATAPLANATSSLVNATSQVLTATSPLANATAPLTPLTNATAPLAQAAATTGTVLGEAGFSWGGYFQAIGVLFLLLAALWAGVWLLRKYSKFNFIPKPGMLPRDALRLEAQLPLGPRKGLMVVRFLNKRLLLGVTDHQITLLTESDAHHDQNNSLEFKDILDEAQRQKTDA